LQSTDRTVAAELSHYLEAYAIDPADPNRADHLEELCHSAVRIKRKIRRHPSTWAFGTWDEENIQFPSVLANGAVVLEAQYE
jgi:hypothetical protein